MSGAGGPGRDLPRGRAVARAMRSRAVGIVAAAVGVLLLLMLMGRIELGGVAPPVGGDRLGPEQGMTVAAYIARARASLDGGDEATGHWALVSLSAAATPSAAADLLDGAAERSGVGPGALRVARVLLQPPLADVSTAVQEIAVPEPSVDRSRRDVLGAAWDKAAATAAAVAGPGRAGGIRRWEAATLRDAGPALIGAVVYARPAVLRSLAATDGVRAVEALPADAVAGVFGVAPLLPANIDIVGPLRDDGPVPGADGTSGGAP